MNISNPTIWAPKALGLALMGVTTIAKADELPTSNHILMEHVPVTSSTSVIWDPRKHGIFQIEWQGCTKDGQQLKSIIDVVADKDTITENLNKGKNGYYKTLDKMAMHVFNSVSKQFENQNYDPNQNYAYIIKNAQNEITQKAPHNVQLKTEKIEETGLSCLYSYKQPSLWRISVS